uniref:Uncharacterized protein n=1 Tax=Astyanax mexicanus TaxID=7994 RepID=A0A3B1IWJ3_ASTMX
MKCCNILWENKTDPVQEWGEEFEDGAVFGITLRREPVQQAAVARWLLSSC